jgi:hypothetical protein
MIGVAMERNLPPDASAQPSSLGPIWALTALLVLAVAVGGCSSPPTPVPTIPIQSPVDTSYAWFQALNDDNLPVALAHLTPAAAAGGWSDFGQVTFSHVSCQLSTSTATSAEVHCSFVTHNPPVELENVDFWNIDMQREGDGPWLISDWGV